MLYNGAVPILEVQLISSRCSWPRGSLLAGDSIELDAGLQVVDSIRRGQEAVLACQDAAPPSNIAVACRRSIIHRRRWPSSRRPSPSVPPPPPREPAVLWGGGRGAGARTSVFASLACTREPVCRPAVNEYIPDGLKRASCSYGAGARLLCLVLQVLNRSLSVWQRVGASFFC